MRTSAQPSITPISFSPLPFPSSEMISHVSAQRIWSKRWIPILLNITVSRMFDQLLVTSSRTGHFRADKTNPMASISQLQSPRVSCPTLTYYLLSLAPCYFLFQQSVTILVCCLIRYLDDPFANISHLINKFVRSYSSPFNLPEAPATSRWGGNMVLVI